MGISVIGTGVMSHPTVRVSGEMCGAARRDGKAGNDAIAIVEVLRAGTSE